MNQQDDQDQRFKTLLHEFFPEFMQLFFPKWFERFDFGRLEWLDKEVFSDPPAGARRTADVVVRIPVKIAPTVTMAVSEPPWLALVHIEVESAESVTFLHARMFDYYVQLRRRYNTPVLPIGVFLRVGLDGLGRAEYTEAIWDDEIVRFQYWYIGLPALAAETYAAGDNPVGLALVSLMKCRKETRVQVLAKAMLALLGCQENDHRRFLLTECLDNYRSLDAEEEKEYHMQITDETARKIDAINYGPVARARVQERRELLASQLEKRFGPLIPEVQERLDAWPGDKLRQLAVDLLSASSLKELGLED